MYGWKSDFGWIVRGVTSSGQYLLCCDHNSGGPSDKSAKSTVTCWLTMVWETSNMEISSAVFLTRVVPANNVFYSHHPSVLHSVLGFYFMGLKSASCRCLQTQGSECVYCHPAGWASDMCGPCMWSIIQLLLCMRLRYRNSNILLLSRKHVQLPHHFLHTIHPHTCYLALLIHVLCSHQLFLIL